MGQIVFNGQKPKYCNLQSIQAGGQHVNDDVALNEIWLVDTTNSNKGTSGTGKYDAYIKGDGIKKAGELTLHYIEPKNLSELIEDTNHRTVTDAEKAVWNSGGGGGEGNPVDNEDLTLALQDSTSVIKFKDRAYSPANYSSLGRKYLRKNIQTVSERTLSNNYEFTNGSIINLASISVGSEVSLTPTTSAGSAYCVIDVQEGDEFYVSGAVGTSARLWGFVDDNNLLLSKNNDANINIGFGQSLITAEATGKLISNVYRPRNINYRIAKINLGEQEELNILTQEMFDSPNTVYIIQYDYTLNFHTITLPENSVLLFDGGSIINGGIIGNNSLFIENNNRAIFNLDTYLCGSWKNTDFRPEYFGAIGDGVMDCYQHIQKILDLISLISDGHNKNCILENSYKISHGLCVYSNTHIIGNANPTWSNIVKTIIADFEDKHQWIIDSASIAFPDYQGGLWETYPVGEICPYDKLCTANSADRGVHRGTPNIVIENVGVYGISTKTSDNIKHYIYGGIRIQQSASHLKSVYVSDVWIGMARTTTWYTSDNDLYINGKAIGIYMGADTNGCSIYNCYVTCGIGSDVDVSEYSKIDGQNAAIKPTNIVLYSFTGNIVNPVLEGGKIGFNIVNSGDRTIHIDNPYIEGTYDYYYYLKESIKLTISGGSYYGSCRLSSVYDESGNNYVVVNGEPTGLFKNNYRLTKTNSFITKEVEKVYNTREISTSYDDGNFVYIRQTGKMYMKGAKGGVGLDGFQYQEQFSGDTVPTQAGLKIGTTYILTQNDRQIPIFESAIGKDTEYKLDVSTLPTKSGKIKIDFLEKSTTFTIEYSDVATNSTYVYQIYRAIHTKYKCFIDRGDPRILHILVPAGISVSATDLVCTDIDDTGIKISRYNPIPYSLPKYVDFFGNNAGFEYVFDTLPLTAVEGTIGFYSYIKKPVYYTEGKWYDFADNEVTNPVEESEE